MDMIEKARKVIYCLEQDGVDKDYEVTDKTENSIILQTCKEIAGIKCAIGIIFNNSPYTLIEVCIGELRNLNNEPLLLSLLNDINRDQLAVKYYYCKNVGIVMARLTYIALDNEFNGSLLYNLQLVAEDFIKCEIKNIIRILDM